MLAMKKEGAARLAVQLYNLPGQTRIHKEKAAKAEPAVFRSRHRVALEDSGRDRLYKDPHNLTLRPNPEARNKSFCCLVMNCPKRRK